MKAPFRLIPDNLSQDTIECLCELLHEAQKGEVIGLAYAAMLRGRVYVVNTAGECHRNRTFARGMVADLHDLLGPPPIP